MVVIYFLLLATWYLPLGTCNLFRATCYLLQVTCYMLFIVNCCFQSEFSIWSRVIWSMLFFCKILLPFAPVMRLALVLFFPCVSYFSSIINFSHSNEEKKLIKHQVQYQVQHAKKWFFPQKDYNKTWTKCSEKLQWMRENIFLERNL